MPIPRINERITAPELLVVDEAEKNLGVMSKEAALNLAREKGLDLIEISAFAKPPVARIISFDKFRYQQEKKIKKQRARQKKQELKQIQISARAARNDLEIKARKVNEFLDDGNQVEIILVLRGREKAHKDWAREKLNEFLKIISPEHRILFGPRFGNKGLILQMIKK